MNKNNSRNNAKHQRPAKGYICLVKIFHSSEVS